VEGGRVPVVAMQGRAHGYEGWSADDVAFGARVLCGLGVKLLLVTNAAGGVNPSYAPGDLVRITDHLNLSGLNPLVGENDDKVGPRFPDLSQAYDAELGALLEQVAVERGIPLRAGVYACMLGPSYETPAEIRMLRLLGADVVGMSTVPEVIAARHMGTRVVGISVVTNLAAGLSRQPLSHAEVQETGARVEARLTTLVTGFLSRAAR
jgi:purine-nucleoside phosphorylase